MTREDYLSVFAMASSEIDFPDDTVWDLSSQPDSIT